MVKFRCWNSVWGKAAEERLKRLVVAKTAREATKAKEIAKLLDEGDVDDQGRIYVIAAFQERKGITSHRLCRGLSSGESC